MEKQITGTIKKIDETKIFGASGFRKRELVVSTNEQYAQLLLIEFIQDKCDLLDAFKVGQEVGISINLKGREWINPEGEAKYFNSIQGWRIIPTVYITPEPVESKVTFITTPPST